jgi:hypothetical protein
MMDIQAMFSGPDGAYRFARWRRPIVPVVFGVEDATLAVFKGAFQAVCHVAGHDMAETDAEMGANLMVFFCRDWAELGQVPGLDQLIPDLAGLVRRLTEAGANQYRGFRHESDGAIRAGFVLLRLDERMSAIPAEVIGLTQAVQVILLWGNQAFEMVPALTVAEGRAVLSPDIARLIRAAYDRVLPDATNDPSHALRLSARLASSPGQ